MINYQNDSFVISPQRLKGEKELPALGLFFVNPGDARKALQVLSDMGGEKRFLFHSGLCVSPCGRFFVAGPSVGAPMAVMTMEKLIALGAQNIYSYSWCGALTKNLKLGDLLLAEAGLCGEGTSSYYSDERQAKASQNAIEKLDSLCYAHEQQLEYGKVWSTDAPYREKRSFLAKLLKENIKGVDMEYSALCTVAKFRRIHFAGLFCVSDELWQESWKPGFSDKTFLQKNSQIIRLLIDGAEVGGLT